MAKNQDSNELYGSEPPRQPSRFDAGTGQGTSSGPPDDVEFQDRPVLDGSTLSDASEAQVRNPHRGQADPGSETKQEPLNTGSSLIWLIAANLAAVALTAWLLFLFPWNPVLSSVGVLFVILGLVAMLIIRRLRMRRQRKLRVEALILLVIWIVPFGCGLAILFTSLYQYLPS